jgi:hypothetical protein
MPQGPVVAIQEVGAGRSITAVATTVAAFVGFFGAGVADRPVAVASFRDFEREFGGLDPAFPASYGVHAFFANGGRQAIVVRVDATTQSAGDALIGLSPSTGLNALLDTDSFNLLCIPDTFELPDADAARVAEAAIRLCEARRAFYLVDAPKAKALGDIVAWVDGLSPSRNAAVYFPAICLADPLDNAQTRTVAPSGSVAGVVVRTDINRGVWKAPAGTEATLNGVRSLAVAISDHENGDINRLRINALRSFPGRTVVWGSRTLAGADAMTDPFKYVPVRRLALFIEESLVRGTQWAVFDANGEALWAQLRLHAEAFMQELFRDGALQGASPKDAYYVRCGADTTSMADIEQGVVNLLVGFAPSRPAGFLTINIRLAMA